MAQKTFYNPHPTSAEAKLYQYAGYYLIKHNPSTNFYSYAQCCSPKDERTSIPKYIVLEEGAIDYDTYITFYTDAETIKFSGMADMALLELIMERAEELGYTSLNEYQELSKQNRSI